MDDLFRQYEDDDIADYLLCACIDLDSAFDSIEMDYLIVLLEDMNLPPEITSALKIHLNSIMVSIKGQSTGSFQFTRGVPQGSALSRLLFILVLASIIRKMQAAVTERWP